MIEEYKLYKEDDAVVELDTELLDNQSPGDSSEEGAANERDDKFRSFIKKRRQNKFAMNQLGKQSKQAPKTQAREAKDSSEEACLREGEQRETEIRRIMEELGNEGP